MEISTYPNAITAEKEPSSISHDSKHKAHVSDLHPQSTKADSLEAQAISKFISNQDFQLLIINEYSPSHLLLLIITVFLKKIINCCWVSV